MTDKWLHRVSFYEAALESFLSSSCPFRILQSIPTRAATPRVFPTRLYILDSSFNPPTVAHLDLLQSPLSSSPSTAPQRLLLLLATQNADKMLRPAPLEQRLCIMEILARDLLSTFREDRPVTIDLGVTSLPYFADKAKAIEACDAYHGLEQVHLVGFDTLTRILDIKYYPPTHTLAGLVPFLQRHRLRVTYRGGEVPGWKTEQDKFVRSIAEGGLDHVAGRREWVTEGRIQLVDGRNGMISSTRVREAVDREDWEALRTLITPGVLEWIKQSSPYRKTSGIM